MIDDKVIIINKPPGLTSHEISTLVKKMTGASRAGHAGTLDPEVSGVLPVAIGRATKLLRYMAAKDKTYVGIMKFRIPQTGEQIGKLFESFTGELVQTPPKMSAVRKAPRKRTVYSLKLLETSGRLALFQTKVDAGTYIRTLCEDMGKLCGGARMVELRRVAVGSIAEKDARTMQDLADALWLMRERGERTMLDSMLREPQALIGLPRAHIKENAVASVLAGAQVMMPALERIGDARKGDAVAIYGGGRFIGVGIMQADARDISDRKRGIAIKLERVHMPR